VHIALKKKPRPTEMSVVEPFTLPLISYNEDLSLSPFKPQSIVLLLIDRLSSDNNSPLSLYTLWCYAYVAVYLSDPLGLFKELAVSLGPEPAKRRSNLILVLGDLVDYGYLVDSIKGFSISARAKELVATVALKVLGN
jgi:hypothetical protein